MKTFFGMTAAALLVVMMLFVALPKKALLATVPVEGGDCLPGAKNISVPIRGGSNLCCIDSKTIGLCSKILDIISIS